MLKFLGREMRKPGAEFGPGLLERALCRNFNGKPSVMMGVLQMFSDNYKTKLSQRNVIAMISENLDDPYSRHLMVLTRHSAAWSILKRLKIVDPDNAVLLVSTASTAQLLSACSLPTVGEWAGRWGRWGRWVVRATCALLGCSVAKSFEGPGVLEPQPIPSTR